MTDDEVQDIWERVTQTVMTSAGPAFGAQLALAIPRGIGGGTLYLAVQLEFTLKLLETRLRPEIMAAIAAIPEAREIKNFVVVVDENAHPPLTLKADTDSTYDSQQHQHEEPSLTAPSQTNSSTDGATRRKASVAVSSPRYHRNNEHSVTSHLNRKYRFDSFVIGHSNRFAHAAAVAVAEAPAHAYNPLFIYGGSGLGKTHLLHAIGHYARELFPDIRIRYVSSEDFTNDFINSIANNQGSAFHARYRGVDILLVDDIQFLQDKVETQEAFFHTFNTLHDHNKQVVITSDVQPKQLRGFEERMLSRFEWGLTTDIQAPDLETRIAILRKKSQREGLKIDHNILEFVASKVTSNIRELEGILIRVIAYASLNQEPIDMQLAHTVLKGLTPDTIDEIRPSDIVRLTADYFDLLVDDIYGPTRVQQIATARQIAMYLCRELTPLSLPKIGQLFGGRDHTTVIYAHKKISKLIAERRSIYNQVTELTTRIKNNL